MTVLKSKELTDSLKSLQQRLEFLGMSLGLAESCTGGLLSSWITSLPGVSSFFKGAVVSYDGSVKEKVLGVSHHLISSYGQVSEPVALHMAQGVRKLLVVDWGLSLTGIAGPTGGSSSKPVGTVCFGLCGPGIEKVEQMYFDSQKSRTEIQSLAAEYGLELLRRQLL